MLTPEDEQLIVRAIVTGLAKWSLVCFLAGVLLYLVVRLIESAGGV